MKYALVGKAILCLLEDLDTFLDAECLRRPMASRSVPSELRSRVRLAADELRDLFGNPSEYVPRGEDLAMLAGAVRTIELGGSAIVFADSLDQRDWLEAMLSKAGHAGRVQYIVSESTARRSLEES